MGFINDLFAVHGDAMASAFGKGALYALLLFGIYWAYCRISPEFAEKAKPYEPLVVKWGVRIGAVAVVGIFGAAAWASL